MLFACRTGRLVQNDTKLKKPLSKDRGFFNKRAFASFLFSYILQLHYQGA